MSSSEPWTILRLLNWTTEYLGKHGSQSPRLDAEVLLAHANSCKRVDLYVQFESELPDDIRTNFRELVKKRADGAPVAYLVEHKEFYQLDFRVTPDVLIPRPETEHIVVEMLDRISKDHASDLRIADVGTGSGILAVCAAKYAGNCLVDAIDISPAAIEVARHNAEVNEVGDKITFHLGDLLEPVGDGYDFVLSNPPYVSQQEYNELPTSVKDFEPQQALLAGQGGEDTIARLIPQAAEKLKAAGWLLVELSPMIAQACVELVNADGRFESPTLVKDYARHDRVLIARRK